MMGRQSPNRPWRGIKDIIRYESIITVRDKCNLGGMTAMVIEREKII